MARPKIVRTKEEAASVDPSLPIQVEVSSDPSVVVSNPPATNGQTGAVAPQPLPVAPSPRDDGEITSLKAQLAQLKKDSDARTAQLNEQISAAQRREDEMRRQYSTRDQQTQNAMAQAYQAQVDAVDNATAAAQSALDSAKSGLAIAGQTGDWQTMAEAQERIAEAKTRLVQLADVKANLTERAQRTQQQQQQYQQPPRSTDEAIDQMAISYQQKQWFKKHPDVLYDERKRTKVSMAHYEAIDKGFAQDSPQYFDAVDVYMGYKEMPKSDDDDDSGLSAPQPQSVSAPVSRDAPSAATGRPTTTRITLTAAQREAARDAGVDEITYARGLLELERRKQLGLYQNG